MAVIGSSSTTLIGSSTTAQPITAIVLRSIDAAAPVGNEVAPSKTAPAPLQRRKRISTLPNLAKPRVSNSASAGVPPPKPSQVDTPSTPPIIPAPCKIEGPSPEKGKVQSPQKSPVPVSTPQGQHVTLPEKRTPVPQVPQFSAYKKSVLKQQEVSPAKAVDCAQTEEPSPLKERPSQKSCSNEVFEVIKKTTAKKITAGNLEKERLKRAQKLRDLLRAELRKERKARKAKHPVINPTVEPEKSKMTMRDFIHFIPLTNPMSSSLEESKSSEKSFPVESQPTGIVGKNGSEEDDLDDDDEEDDSQLLAPRVKVAEDGSIILDEESLTVEVSRNKAPIVEGNDPIFERGSTTTYSSFRKNNYSKPWSEPETDMFFLAISMVGTDFSMIGQLFPHRERIEIKNKFKKEERVNGWRIDKAFREKKEFDFEFFAELLEKALEAGNKRKARSKQPRKTNAKSRKKQKDKTAAEQSLCDEESVLSEEEGADARTAEKENKRSLEDDECSGVADPVPVKKKRSKRKKDNAKEPEEEHRESQDDDSTQKPKKKPRKRKTTALDTDDKPELPSLDNDGSLKETPAVKKGVQEHKPNYKESEVEDDENDADFVISEDIGDDVHMSCKAGEAEPATEMSDPTCDEESSLILFSEQSDYQSGLDDLSGHEEPSISVTQSTESPVKPAPVARGRLQKPKPNLLRASGRKGEFEMNKSESLEAVTAEKRSVSHNLISSLLPKDQFQRPKPNLCRAAAKPDDLPSPDEPENIPQGEASVESAVETKDATSNVRSCSLTSIISIIPSKELNKDCVVATSSPANKRKALDTNSDLSPKRICPAGTPQKSARLSDSEGDKDPMSEPSSSSHPSSVQDTDTQRSRFGRPLRRLSAAPSASPKSETSSDRPEKEKPVRSVKSNATKVSKLVSSKSKGKTTLVKLRATQQQEEDEEDADLGSDEENYDLSPDMQNQAPVFVPFSLRSPRPVTAEIEETLEELSSREENCFEDELSESHSNSDLDEEQASKLPSLVKSLIVAVKDQLPASYTETFFLQYDGSAEAAMTLISMGGSVYEQNIDCLVGEHGTGEEATFILTLVEIPINDSYGYSCDSNMAERLPAPVLISSGSCQALTQNLNPRPGKKPLGFLSLVCKEKQLKKANEEKQKKKTLPRLTSRKISPTITDDQEPDLQAPSKSHDLSTEEEAAPVSEYFFSDIFMEVDD
ncbi:hypothetical protein GDO78_007717 [Eleutherodactylus coqui]|uniref:Myb-like domain-containing protein n=1 Tax=Eleutherodactylus coqui TaxID=57060 RepID=A0A8J6FI88_ELECQ|nr:hypothetical protein GDO78_007717 [Eleutherodactylus coqui]